MSTWERLGPHVHPPLFLAGVPIQRVDEPGECAEIDRVLGHQGGAIDPVDDPHLGLVDAVVFLVEGKGPFHLAVGGQLVERGLVHRAEVDAAVDNDRRGVDDADLEVGPLGRKAPLFFQPADVRPGQGGFTCIVTPTENITVVRRPVLGIDTACLSVERELRSSRKDPENEDEADREGAAWHGFSKYSLGRTSELLCRLRLGRQGTRSSLGVPHVPAVRKT